MIAPCGASAASRMIDGQSGRRRVRASTSAASRRPRRISRARVPPRVARPRLRRRDALPAADRRPARRRPRTCCRRPARSSSLGTIYNTDRPYSTEIADRDRRADRALRVGRRLPRRDRAAARRAARDGCASEARRPFEAPRLRRHRAGAGARLRAVRRARLDRQEHLPDQSASSDRGSSSSEIICNLDARARRAGARSVRHVHAVPRRVSDRRARRARRARLDALPLVPDDRDQGRDSRASIATPIGAHAYGCDICQEVCPWNLHGRRRRRIRAVAAADGPRRARAARPLAAIGRRAAARC